jgi:predicted transcriptional regulator of viral defense system
MKRGRIREGAPVRIEYVHVNQHNFVGFQSISKAPNVRVATIERTLLDVLDRPDYSGGISDIPEIFRRATSRAKVDKILEYMPKYHSKSLAQRIGFMLEAFGYQLTSKHDNELQKLSKGNHAYLFTAGYPGTDSHSRYNSKWRLVINAPGFLPAEKTG